MTEFELFQALRPHYPSREYALLPQVANGTGARTFRHCDALALSLWPSRGMHLSGFEMKSYRGDWLRELKNPEKAEEVAQYCNYWWIVASGPFVKAEELPQPWGLMVWDATKGILLKIKAAPFREAVNPDLPFIAAMLRKAQDVVTPDGALEDARRDALEKGRKEGEARCKYDIEDFAKLKQRVQTFERASGVKLDTWNDAHDIGEAVKMVLNDTVSRGRDNLRRIAEQIVKDLGHGSTA
jgi:hypothetical protein